MSDSNRGQLAYIKEVTYGETPASALQKLPFTDEAINYDQENINSSIVRSDRQITDLVLTGAESSGGYGTEIMYAAFDEFFESAFSDDWVGVAGGSTEVITAGAANDEISLDSASDAITFGSNHTIDIIGGQWIKLTGSSNDDGYHFVTQVIGNVVSVSTSPGLQTTETLTGGETVKGARLTNGVKKHSFTVERFLEDKGDYFAYKGMIVNTFGITVSTGAIITGTFEFIGGKSVAGTSTVGSGPYTDAPANEVMNAVSNVADIREGDNLVPLTGVFVEEVSFSINNNLRGIQAVGFAENVDIGQGSFEVTGTLNIHYEDLSLYNKYIASELTGLSFKLEDDPTAGAGNAYVFTFPQIKYASDAINITGQNSDVIENLTWTAMAHSIHGHTASVCRFTAG